eukprot:gnl/TRDRNA2_/TRDRNA2_160980_c1_seq2.p1 gnl/TRDRNA2_/TRDRNA2_160980_c1~~gnl/TRDRNA2_/TRDRNA2_160980_c1_seq2.p1  ORF type:complete len:364 (+),score=69.17 gnl/TRDRNA2_/TRDRNA2_160980_c1_seq2:96-1187(+)
MRRNEKLTYRYATSLHWSLTQFTPASMSVQPHNIKERIYAIIVVLFAMITFSSFVSSITNAMTQLRNLNSQSAHQFWILRKYLRENKISRDLTTRLNRYLEHVMRVRGRKVQPKAVELLSYLSEPLHDELVKEIYEPRLTVHPFFRELGNTTKPVMRKLCRTAVGQVPLSHGDHLFITGQASENMFFLLNGFMVYTQHPPYCKSEEANMPTGVKEGDWCCEPALWTLWVHRGEMQAETDCSLLSLNTAKFLSIARSHPMEMRLPMLYAKAFVEGLNRALELVGKSGVSDVATYVFDIQETLDAIHPKAGELDEYGNVIEGGEDGDEVADAAEGNHTVGVDSAEQLEVTPQTESSRRGDVIAKL